MRGLGLRAYPLIVLLALSQLAGPAASAAGRREAESGPPPPRSAPPEERARGDRPGHAARAPARASRRAPTLALLLLLEDAATRGRMK